MEKKNADELLKRIQEGNASEKELALFESWYLQYNAEKGHAYSVTELERIKLEMKKRLPVSGTKLSIIKLWPRLPFRPARIAAAAAILVFLSFGIYIYLGYTNKADTQYANLNSKNDITPGGNKAILTLADGSKISLTDARNGQLAEQSGVKITKAADGQLIYQFSASNSQLSVLEYNTIETPRGGQYQVILPDGTQVWLNAASSLKYPASFASLKERKVELDGEAYFEVAKDKSHPFLVKTDKQEIEVLGTHFNVNAYTDEFVVKTTLLEGSVKVIVPGAASSLERAGMMLKPGEQSVLTNNRMTVSTADPEEAIAWKNGYFRFDDEKLESIMRKVSRWYDVEVYYEDELLKEELFGAVTTRFTNVSKLLKMLEQTGAAKFNIEGRKITISRGKSD